MKIKMLSTQYDDEKNIVIWNNNDIFTVDEEKEINNGFYIVKTINGQQYAVSSRYKDNQFVVLKE